MTTQPTSTSDQPTTRRSLLVRIRDREDHEAWSEFLELYEPVIYRMAQRRRMQDADAREVVQEVLLRVARAIDQFDLDGSGTFRGWLSRTTRHVAVDRFRQLANRKDWVAVTDSAVSQASDVEKEFEREHRGQLFRLAAEAVRREVAPDTWRAFWATAVGGRPAGEVAGELGITPGRVYVARCRVLKRIREFIEHHEAE